MTLRSQLKLTIQRWMIARRGFWFVDVPRTSTTSIKQELEQAFGPVFGKQHGRWSFPDHTPAVEMRRLLTPRVWDRLFTFSIVRNPWSRQLSFYHWARNRGFFKNMTFRDFVLELNKQFETGQSRFNWHGPHFGAVDYLFDTDGRQLVQQIVRFEDREAGLAGIAQRLKLPSLGRNHQNKQTPSDAHYASAYDDETREMIARIYHRDISLFGYTFEQDAPPAGSGL
jgi:hypothetical protein